MIWLQNREEQNRDTKHQPALQWWEEPNNDVIDFNAVTQENMLCNMTLAAQLCSKGWEVHVWAICGVGILITQGCFSDSRVDRTELWLMHHFGMI